MVQYAHQRTYKLEFSEKEWEEIVNLGFEPFEIVAEEDLTRGQWMAVADMAIGKAHRIMHDMFVLDEQDEFATNGLWAAELNLIAHKIYVKFRPGDGQL